MDEDQQALKPIKSMSPVASALRRRSFTSWVVSLTVFGAVALALAAPARARRGKEKPAPPPAAEDAAGKGDGLPTVAAKTSGLEHLDSFLDLWVDREAAKVWLVVPPPGDDGVAAELIYVEGLTTGLGSNPVGLDRGQISEPIFLELRRLGPKVLLQKPNLVYRALDADEAERRATRESFAPSILWAQEIAARDEDGTALVDLTSFLVRDAHDVPRRLREAQQGAFALDSSRSVFDPGASLAFPRNVELEAILTYSSNEPGDEVKATAAEATAFTLVQHHSLVQPPDDDYQPRVFDPRIGLNNLDVHDYAAPLDQPITRRWLMRHRLEKKDPTADRSEAVEPLVYYIDSGAPEPVRSALLDGARWWAEAFEAAGFVDAFRVELLPESIHPLDVRYNVVQWVHRATRGWSYGSPLADPRTGEIIKGHVNLGSLRVRQDILIFEGLLGTAGTGSGAADDPIQLALARIRQLAAHEIGHTLGFTHNFAASSYGDRESVMDYPSPRILVGDDGRLDLSRAYGVGVGDWDIQTIRYGYSVPAPGQNEAELLAGIVRQGLDAGLLFLGDEEARPPGASDPRANLWDNGSDAVAELELSLEVRRIALAAFGQHNLAEGRPLTLLEEVLAPLYFHHRYQLDAAVKTLGGLELRYAVGGDGQAPTRIIEAERQRKALEVVLRLLDPAELDLDETVLDLLTPRPFGYKASREMFTATTAPAFDALGAAQTAADQALRALLQPERLARLHDQHRRHGDLPSVAEVLAAVIERAWEAPADEPRRHAAIRALVRQAVSDRLVQLGRMALYPQLRAEAEAALTNDLIPRAEASGDTQSLAIARDVRRFLERRDDEQRYFVAPAEPPPGGPIGGGLGLVMDCVFAAPR